MNKLDLSNLNNSRTIAALSISPASKVLVVGSHNSNLIAALADKACEVWCIEHDKSAASEAAQLCQRALAGNLESIDLRAELGESEFDAILMLDALESLRYPEDALRNLSCHLRPSGVLVASAFNVAHAAVKLDLLEGRFPYAEGGPLDPEHIRFFDRAGVRKLFDGALLGIIDELDVIRALDDAELETAKGQHSEETIGDALTDPDALTHKFVIFASSAALDYATDTPHTQAGIATLLDRRAREAELQLAKAEQRAEIAMERVHELEILLGQMADDLSEARRSRAETLHVAELERRHLQADLSIKDRYIADIRHRIEDVDAMRLRLAKSEESLREIKQVIDASAGYRAADRVNETLSRYPTLHRMTRSLARIVARRPR